MSGRRLASPAYPVPVTDRPLPTGTLTFLAADMEGSTLLIQRVGPAAFRDIIEQHNEILRSAFARWDGTERGTQGDSFLVMFREAGAALRAAAEAQVALASAEWPKGAAVRVRMGSHTGVAALGGDDYVGVDVHLVARIAAAAHGGQILVSETTRALGAADPPPDATFRSLGEHKLRDIARPVHLYQLVVARLQSDFPPIETATSAAGDNLPERLTTFIGREAELEELAALLAAGRLVTLTGPGGTGKTSLVIELARAHAADFPDGAWFIGLEAVTDPGLVPASIAGALRLVPTTGVSVADQVTNYFRDRSVLVILDNFEQILPAADFLRDLVQAASGLKLLVTSRAALHLSAEQEYPVAPFIPPRNAGDGVDALQNPAVRLFIDRARRVSPGYQPQGNELVAIGEICRRLDGLPLGIELAASRVGFLPPATIASRLAERLDFPGAAARDLPERQRSMEQAIAWSYDLLEPPVQRMLGRLSVFRGGCRLEEAEAVCGPPPEFGTDVLVGLSVLVDHSLVRPLRGLDGARFELLETIRAFAFKRLESAGESVSIERRHAFAYRDLAESAAPHMPGGEQRAWLDRLSAEHDNLRAATRWAIEHGDAEMALRLGAALWRFWQLRGHLEEGRAELDRILAMPGSEEPTPWRMRALEAAGGLGWWASDLSATDGAYRAQLELARRLGDSQGIADAAFNYAHTQIELHRDPSQLGLLVAEAGHHYEQAGDERGLARVRHGQVSMMFVLGDPAAEDELRALLRRFEQLGDEWYGAQVQSNLAWLAFAREDFREALRWSALPLAAARQMGDIPGMVILLRPTAAILLRAGMPHDAATTYGAFESLLRRYALALPPPAESIFPALSREQFEITDADYDQAVARGAAMTEEEAIDFVIGVCHAYVK